jgi:pyrimidine operon attenuation protein/uracil phosphoribosyltransferase
MSTPRRPPDAHLAPRRELLDAAGIARALRRIAHEIVERNGGASGLTLVGVRTGGVPLAGRLATMIAEAEGHAPGVGAIDITLYRDDVFEGLPKPEVGRTELPGQIAGQKLIVVDDVLYTGRTIRAALDALMDFGRPRAVELAVLIDRGLRELPIQPDYVGLKVSTEKTESVRVDLVETDGVDRAVLRAAVQQ